MIHPFGQLERRSLKRRSWRGFTLVELLVTLSIIGILATAMLGVAAVAGDTARKAKTRHTISRLHTLLMEQVDSYKTRRVSLDPEFRKNITNGITLSKARLFALRELMLMELPDRWSDITLCPRYLEDRPGLSEVYLRRYEHIAGANNKLTAKTNTPEDIVLHQGAECLYLVITLATADGEARSLFGESSIGDIDGDGAPEFLDGWGNPISFLRWAPGFESDAQLNIHDIHDPDWQNKVAEDHDPFDMYRVDQYAFRTMPLIFSAGPDELYGIYTTDTTDEMIWPDSYQGLGIFGTILKQSSGNPVCPSGKMDCEKFSPFELASKISNAPGTMQNASDAADNIHNHLITGQ